jgi:hypothetical protein
MTVWSVYAGWYDDDVKAKQRLFLEESDAEDYRKKLFDEGWDFCTKEPMEVH